MGTNNSGISTGYTLHNLNKTQRSMNSSIERISSGKRINHAGDDAAGAWRNLHRNPILRIF